VFEIKKAGLMNPNPEHLIGESQLRSDKPHIAAQSIAARVSMVSHIMAAI
jgi:hypothetical protein